jgi:CRISPR-associated protein Cmr6
MLPLSKEKKLRTTNGTGNQGLYFNKFFDQWSGGFQKVLEPTKDSKGGKIIWINKFKGPSNDGAPMAGRITDLAEGIGGSSVNYIITGPFITGMGLSHPVENGFLWHHTLGIPYLPGSSIKGMIRAWVRYWSQEDDELEDEIGRLFGRDDQHKEGHTAGNIIVFDALPVKPIKLYAEIITPHDGGWRISGEPEKNPPADWISPNPIPFLAVEEGAEFQFTIAPRKRAEPDDLDKAWTYLADALEWIGAGAKTAVGFGRFVDAPVSWAVGDNATLELAGDMEVAIESLDADGAPLSVRATERGQIIKITDPSVLRRP